MSRHFSRRRESHRHGDAFHHARFERLALLVFEQAVLAEGRQLDDPAAFVARLNELLVDIGRQDSRT